MTSPGKTSHNWSLDTLLCSCGFLGYATRRILAAGRWMRRDAYADRWSPEDLLARSPSVLQFMAYLPEYNPLFHASSSAPHGNPSCTQKVHHIEPVLVFSRLTYLHVYWEFDDPDCPSSPLEPEEAREIVRSFSRMRDLLLNVKFALSELPTLAENCSDLLELDLSVWAFPHEVKDGRLHVDPPTHGSSSVREARVRTEWLQEVCPHDIDDSVATYIGELLLPRGMDLELDFEDDV